MDVLSVPRPVGALIATGQRTLVLFDERPSSRPREVVIHNHTMALPRTEGDARAVQLLRSEEDGADLGSDMGTGLDRAGALVAVAHVLLLRQITTWSAEDVLRATSLSITERSEDHVLDVYSPDRVMWAARLSNIRPLPLDHHLLRLSAPSSLTPPCIWFSPDSRVRRAVAELAQDALTLSEPTIAT